MMKTWLGFGDLALIIKVKAELNRSNLRALACHFLVCKICHELVSVLELNLHGYNIGA